MLSKDITSSLQWILTPAEINLLGRLHKDLAKGLSLAVLYGADLGSAIGKRPVSGTVNGLDKGVEQALYLCARFGHEARQMIGFQTVLQACLDNGGFPDDLP